MYLFLAIPNFCGSTLVHSLLETVPSVVPLTRNKQYGKDDFVEGNCIVGNRGYRKFTLGPHSIEANMLHVHQNPKNYDWDFIKEVWEQNWIASNYLATIKLQKTPSDVLRMEIMNKAFPDAMWILSVRNPYAYVESIMRKATFGMSPIIQLDQICFHVLKVMELQIENAKLLGNRAYVMTYEDFISRPEYHRDQMAKWIPDLKYIDFKSQELMVKGSKVVEIKDDSQMRIQSLIDNVPSIISMINEHFRPMEHLLKYWGYELYEDSCDGTAGVWENNFSQRTIQNAQCYTH